jgi:hypothetical protein
MNRFLLNFSDVPADRRAEADACGERVRHGWLLDMASPCFDALVPRAKTLRRVTPDGRLPRPASVPAPLPAPAPVRPETPEQRDARELAEAIADPKGLGDRLARLIHVTSADRVHAAYLRHVRAAAQCRCNARRKRLNRAGELLAGLIGRR